MYRRPKFLEILIRIREEMAREADYDTDLFAELVRSGNSSVPAKRHVLADTDNEAPRAKRRAR